MTIVDNVNILVVNVLHICIVHILLRIYKISVKSKNDLINVEYIIGRCYEICEGILLFSRLVEELVSTIALMLGQLTYLSRSEEPFECGGWRQVS